jgi:hypothetical protein
MHRVFISTSKVLSALLLFLAFAMSAERHSMHSAAAQDNGREMLLGSITSNARLYLADGAENRDLIITSVKAGDCGGAVPVFINVPLNERGEGHQAVTPPFQNDTYRFQPPLPISAGKVQQIWMNCFDAKFYGRPDTH